MTLIREVGSNDKILVFDSSTGLICDQIITNFSGAYCYSDQQTEWGCDFGQNMLNAKEDIWNFIFNNSFMDGLNNEVLGIAGSVSMSVGVACLPAFPVGTVVGLGLIGFGLYSTYYADDLNRGITDQRLAHFGLDVGLSLIPGVGSELKMGKIVLSKGTKEISSKIVTRNSFAFEKYLVEKGETEVLYNGLSRTSIKYGTLDHAVDMVWDLTKENIYKDLRNNYLYYKPIHYAFNVYYNDYNFNDAIWDTLDTSI